MTTFWLKEIVDRKLFLPSGAPVPFESVDGIYGILSTEDPFIAIELEKSVRNHVGGVMKLTEEEYSEWKKKLLLQGSQPSLPRERETLGAIPPAELQKLRSQGLAAVVGGVDAAGNVVPPMNQPVSGPNQVQQQARSQRVPAIDVPTEFKVPARVGKPATARKSTGAPLPPSNVA